MSATRKRAVAAVWRVHTQARAKGKPVTSFAVRARAESAARDVWQSALETPEFRSSTDRKTASLATFFALSECNPTADCMLYCYILHNVASGPNTPHAVAKAVENTLAATQAPKLTADALVAEARKKRLTLRLASGGEAPAELIRHVAEQIPTRILFSTDSTTPKSRVPPGARTAYVVRSSTEEPPTDAHVVFSYHRGRHHTKTPQTPVLCPATAQNNVCGVSCFRCFPFESAPPGAAAWGFTRKPATWHATADATI
jgi:hypothetical protein